MTGMVDPRKLDVAADLYAERSVLGILLRNSDLLDLVDRLRPEHFLLPAHQAIFESIERLSMADAKEPLNKSNEPVRI